MKRTLTALALLFLLAGTARGETLTLSFTGLSEDTEYTLSIIPVTSWENEGEPLVVDREEIIPAKGQGLI